MNEKKWQKIEKEIINDLSVLFNGSTKSKPFEVTNEDVQSHMKRMAAAGFVVNQKRWDWVFNEKKTEINIFFNLPPIKDI